MNDLVVVPERQETLENVLLLGVSNAHTRRAYCRALDNFMNWYSAQEHRELSRLVLEDYRAHLETSGAAASSINQELPLCGGYSEERQPPGSSIVIEPPMPLRSATAAPQASGQGIG